MQWRRLGPAIPHSNLDQEVFGRFFPVLNEDIEVAVFVKDTAVKQFVFELIAVPLPVLVD